jgi:hypothetical protein
MKYFEQPWGRFEREGRRMTEAFDRRG